MKKVEEDRNKWKDSLCSWTERINIVKISIAQKVIYRFSAVPIKIPMEFWTEIGKTILKCIWEHRSPWRVKTFLNKNKAGSIILSYFKYIVKLYGTNIKMHWSINRIKSPEINPCIHGQLIFNKRAINAKWEMHSFLK